MFEEFSPTGCPNPPGIGRILVLDFRALPIGPYRALYRALFRDLYRSRFWALFSLCGLPFVGLAIACLRITTGLSGKFLNGPPDDPCRHQLKMNVGGYVAL